jgi:hypothetical protein
MVVLIDLYGYRLVAISLLPIDRQTLIYGTCDSGKTVYSSDKTFNTIMEGFFSLLKILSLVIISAWSVECFTIIEVVIVECGRELNLTEHDCGVSAEKSSRKILHTAADVEGHRGFCFVIQNRIYIYWDHSFRLGR